MKIIKRINYFKGSDLKTLHINEERFKRVETYYSTLDSGKWVASFIVDKNHENGREIHVIYTNRLIEIYNERTRKFITVLYARNGQIKRYFKTAPMHLFDEFIEGYNNL